MRPPRIRAGTRPRAAATGRARTEMIAYFHSNPALVVSVPCAPGVAPHVDSEMQQQARRPSPHAPVQEHLDEARLRHEPLVAKVVLGQRQEQPAPVRPVACNTGSQERVVRATGAGGKRAPPHLNTAARESSKGSARIASIRSTLPPHTDSTAQRGAGRGTQHGQGPPHFLPTLLHRRFDSTPGGGSGRSTQTPHLRCPKSVRQIPRVGPPPTAVFNLASSATTVSRGIEDLRQPVQRGDAGATPPSCAPSRPRQDGGQRNAIPGQTRRRPARTSFTSSGMR